MGIPNFSLLIPVSLFRRTSTAIGQQLELQGTLSPPKGVATTEAVDVAHVDPGEVLRDIAHHIPEERDHRVRDEGSLRGRALTSVLRHPAECGH